MAVSDKNCMSKQDATQIVLDVIRRIKDLGRTNGCAASIRGCEERIAYLSQHCFDEGDQVPALLAAAAQRDLETLMRLLDNQKDEPK